MSQEKSETHAVGETVETLESAALTAFSSAVQPALDEANKTASGIREWSAGEEGRAGAQLHSLLYRFHGETSADALKDMVAGTFDPSDGSSSPVVEVRSAAGANADEVSACFDAWAPSGADERRAVAALAGQIATAAGAQPGLALFVAKGAAPTSRSSGVAVVDASAREAVWIFGRAVRMTVDRR